MTIVMGLDQHRAQITAEWIDTATGEISRAARRAGATARACGGSPRASAARSSRWRWRRRRAGGSSSRNSAAVGARVHLAEPAETAARRGTKKRAKSDRADARHLRELLMVGRLPESWIPPEHLLDLRARVRLRHTLVEQRREWQQRIQAVLYHHGVPPRSWLLGAESRAWLAGLQLPPAAREQITIALALIDAHDAQLAPLDQRAARLRQAPARLPGADAPLRDRAADVGHDPRRARRRAPLLAPRARPSATPAWTSPSTSPTRAAPPAASPAKDPPALRWALFEAAQCARRPGSPDHDYYLADGRAARRQPRLPGRRAQAAQAQLPHAARTRRGGPGSPHDRRSARAALTHADAPRPAPGMLLPPPPRGRPS